MSLGVAGAEWPEDKALGGQRGQRGFDPSGSNYKVAPHAARRDLGAGEALSAAPAERR